MFISNPQNYEIMKPKYFLSTLLFDGNCVSAMQFYKSVFPGVLYNQSSRINDKRHDAARQSSQSNQCQINQ